MSKKSKKNQDQSKELENKDEILENNNDETQETDVEGIVKEEKEEQEQVLDEASSLDNNLQSETPIREQIEQKSKKELEIEQRQAIKIS